MSKEYCVRDIPQRKHRTPRELVMGREIFNENFRSHSQVDRAPQSGRGVWVRTDDSHESVRIWTTRTHTSRTTGKARHQLGHCPSSVHLPTSSFSVGGSVPPLKYSSERNRQRRGPVAVAQHGSVTSSDSVRPSLEHLYGRKHERPDADAGSGLARGVNGLSMERPW